MEQLMLGIAEDKTPDADEEPAEQVRWVEVCDLPYFTEPEAFYDKRMRERIRVRELRRFATSIFDKPKEEPDRPRLEACFPEEVPFCDSGRRE